MKEVKITEALLKEYKDDELIHYVSEKLRWAITCDIAEEISSEAKLTLRLSRIGELMNILTAVDKRMNKVSSDPKIVL